jgi:hypothetical protein
MIEFWMLLRSHTAKTKTLRPDSLAQLVWPRLGHSACFDNFENCLKHRQVTISGVEYLMDFTVHSTILSNCPVSTIHNSKGNTVELHYVRQYGKEGDRLLDCRAKHIAHTRCAVHCAQTVDKLRGGPEAEAARMEYSKQLKNVSKIICLAILRGDASMLSQL